MRSESVKVRLTIRRDSALFSRAVRLASKVEVIACELALTRLDMSMPKTRKRARMTMTPEVMENTRMNP